MQQNNEIALRRPCLRNVQRDAVRGDPFMGYALNFRAVRHHGTLVRVGPSADKDGTMVLLAYRRAKSALKATRGLNSEEGGSIKLSTR